MKRPALWVRSEIKQFERRTALTPSSAKTLVQLGFDVFVEKDSQRIFNDAEYDAVGCTLVENSTWPSAPTNTPVLGLKELPEYTSPLTHDHIHFGHCYKQQVGWVEHLDRFQQGGGTLYDLEFLTDDTGRRVAAFGFHAGFAGAAVGALGFAAKKSGGEVANLKPFDSEASLVEEVKTQLAASVQDLKVLIIGALGRCGTGAVNLFRRIGLKEANIIKWDMAETAKGGPFQEILDVDIFVNCIYLNSPIPSFLTVETLRHAGSGRRLAVVVDVSCDATNPFNPLPIYTEVSTFAKPTVRLELGVVPPLDVVSIDQLPTLVPREASEQFSAALLPSLLQLPSRKTSPVWMRAEQNFQTKLTEAAACSS